MGLHISRGPKLLTRESSIDREMFRYPEITKTYGQQSEMASTAGYNGAAGDSYLFVARPARPARHKRTRQ